MSSVGRCESCAAAAVHGEGSVLRCEDERASVAHGQQWGQRSRDRGQGRDRSCDRSALWMIGATCPASAPTWTLRNPPSQLPGRLHPVRLDPAVRSLLSSTAPYDRPTVRLALVEERD
jgi:hypothetical protein